MISCHQLLNSLEVTILKRVVNCVLRNNNKVLMLQKPRRGWWVVPGGKMENNESIHEAVVREYLEETDLTIEDPTLKGVFNIIIKDGDKIIEEWMMFTFFATKYTGVLTDYCEEGRLEWKNIQDILSLPKAKGDNIYLKNIILHSNKLITGKFYYTPSYELISYSLDHTLEPVTQV